MWIYYSFAALHISMHHFHKRPWERGSCVYRASTTTPLSPNSCKRQDKRHLPTALLLNKALHVMDYSRLQTWTQANGKKKQGIRPYDPYKYAHHCKRSLWDICTRSRERNMLFLATKRMYARQGPEMILKRPSSFVTDYDTRHHILLRPRYAASGVSDLLSIFSTRIGNTVALNYTIKPNNDGAKKGFPHLRWLPYWIGGTRMSRVAKLENKFAPRQEHYA